jgi:hypothetical protein
MCSTSLELWIVVTAGGMAKIQITFDGRAGNGEDFARITPGPEGPRLAEARVPFQ